MQWGCLLACLHAGHVALTGSGTSGMKYAGTRAWPSHQACAWTGAPHPHSSEHCDDAAIMIEFQAKHVAMPRTALARALQDGRKLSNQPAQAHHPAAHLHGICSSFHSPMVMPAPLSACWPCCTDWLWDKWNEICWHTSVAFTPSLWLDKCTSSSLPHSLCTALLLHPLG